MHAGYENKAIGQQAKCNLKGLFLVNSACAEMIRL